jgi:hypothetical protein
LAEVEAAVEDVTTIAARHANPASLAGSLFDSLDFRRRRQIAGQDNDKREQEGL